jgi:hypothetical protein
MKLGIHFDLVLYYYSLGEKFQGGIRRLQWDRKVGLAVGFPLG